MGTAFGMFDYAVCVSVPASSSWWRNAVYAVWHTTLCGWLPGCRSSSCRRAGLRQFLCDVFLLRCTSSFWFYPSHFPVCYWMVHTCGCVPFVIFRKAGGWFCLFLLRRTFTLLWRARCQRTACTSLCLICFDSSVLSAVSWFTIFTFYLPRCQMMRERQIYLCGLYCKKVALTDAYLCHSKEVSLFNNYSTKQYY